MSPTEDAHSNRSTQTPTLTYKSRTPEILHSQRTVTRSRDTVTGLGETPCHWWNEDNRQRPRLLGGQGPEEVVTGPDL